MNPHFVRFFSTLTLLLSTALAAHAAGNHQYEILVQTANVDEKTSETDANSIAARIYLDEVQVRNHPYEEAGFLDKKSNLIVGYLKAEYTSTVLDVDISNFVLLGTYIDPESSFIFQVRYIDIGEDYKNGTSGTGNGDAFGFALGTYVNPGSTILFSYLSVDDTVELTSPARTLNIETTDISLEYKSVTEYSDNTAVNTEFSFTSSKTEVSTSQETNTILELAGDYYFNQATSLGAVAELNSGDNKSAKGKTLGLRATYYLTPYFSVYGDIARFSADDNLAGEDTDTTTIGATARF